MAQPPPTTTSSQMETGILVERSSTVICESAHSHSGIGKTGAKVHHSVVLAHEFKLAGDDSAKERGGSEIWVDRGKVFVWSSREALLKFEKTIQCIVDWKPQKTFTDFN